MPGEDVGQLAQPFEIKTDKAGNTKVCLRKLNSSEWLHLAGPIGIYYINETDLHPRYKRAFTDVLWWLYEVRTRSVRISGMKKHENDEDYREGEYDYHRYWRENAVILEYLMPYNFNQIVVHLCQHIIDDIYYFGPVYAQWMYPFEATHGWLKNSYHGLKVPEESMCRVISSQWRTMLHEHDDVEDDNAALEQLWNPGLKGSYPTTILIEDKKKKNNIIT